MHSSLLHKAQNKYFSKTKDELIEGAAIILVNFSENYTCIMQDAIQSVHWKKEQVTILAYVKGTANDKLKPIPMCVISDHLVHDTTTFWTFQKVIDQDLIKEVSQIKYIKYFSDGSSAQYKNFKNFINLCHHEKDHGVKAEWHFLHLAMGKELVMV
ncbi:hypothetical protein AVEN_251751-1 [Araneus ventricosus]|uniref:Uncharacterized protein n=1 Tax=Araneus ventricosus TaxID=182803 RepID=A0A4Y2BPN6_ARAVE|nr:hypothetical protein AVEN_251751-1 [Araneus ventricosus]